MPLGKQAKTLSQTQVDAMCAYLRTKRNGVRNELIFLLSAKAGLRAKEIASLRWTMVTDADGELADSISLPNSASKGCSGRSVPISKALRLALGAERSRRRSEWPFPASAHVVASSRSDRVAPQVIVNMFYQWYRQVGFDGCSSHSGRRTFITNAARRISTVGGSLRDVQVLAGHSSLQVTQRYIDCDSAAQRRVVDLI
ncbi:site-specific tyrosine recombinase XerC [Tsuneonella dongtanensis]|uniref:Site-specific tyrosine recombinase XerC n=1 Tax=Tsuneonella dongtanensis TaxID=692370 RepID=A0A1B2A907_9SPHN|nr:site-specific integrase [Tsuneonella dongtanensis]ANY18663.1 site-specific tyrosine recombinase XerC [Tsuneonella dongtanensis]